jgi:hypothetical protein
MTTTMTHHAAAANAAAANPTAASTSHVFSIRTTGVCE